MLKVCKEELCVKDNRFNMTFERFRLKQSEVFSALLITVLGSGLSKLILVGVTFYCTNSLSKEGFGELSFIRNTLQMILCLCVANFVNLCTKYVAELFTQKESGSKLFLLFLFSLSICVCFSIIINIIPDDQLLKFIHSANLIPFFRILGLLLPLFMLQPLIEGVLRGLKKFKLIGLLQVSTSIFFAFCVICGTYFFSTKGAIVGVLLYYTLYSLISLFLLSRNVNIIASIRKYSKNAYKEISTLYKIIFPVFLLSFIDAPVNWWAQVYMSKLEGMESIASMTVILQVRNIMLLIPTYYFSTLTTFVARQNAEGCLISYYSKFNKSIKCLLLFSVFGVFLLQLLEQPILGLFGGEYKNEFFPYLISNLAIPFLIIGNLLKIDLVVREFQGFLLFVSTISSALFILSLYSLTYLGYSSVVAYFFGQLVQVLVITVMCAYVYVKGFLSCKYGKK